MLAPAPLAQGVLRSADLPTGRQGAGLVESRTGVVVGRS